MLEKIRTYALTSPRRRSAGFILLALSLLLVIYDRLDLRRELHLWVPLIPLGAGMLLLLPDLFTLASRKLLGLCLLIATAVTLYFSRAELLLLAVALFPALCTLICFLPKLRWLRWVLLGLFVLANIAAIYPLRGHLLTLWFFLCGVNTFHPLNVIASFMLNLMLPFVILGFVLTRRKPPKTEPSQAVQ